MTASGTLKTIRFMKRIQTARLAMGVVLFLLANSVLGAYLSGTMIPVVATSVAASADVSGAEATTSMPCHVQIEDHDPMSAADAVMPCCDHHGKANCQGCSPVVGAVPTVVAIEIVSEPPVFDVVLVPEVQSLDFPPLIPPPSFS